MKTRLGVFLSLLVLACPFAARAQWLAVTNLTAQLVESEDAGPHLLIEYDLNEPGLSADAPAYVFVRYRKPPEKTWRLVSPRFLRGIGHGIVDSKGHKKSDWWGIAVAGIKDLKEVELRIRAIAMCRVPAGAFRMKTVLGAGHDPSKTATDPCVLPAFWMAKHETTIGMYADYLAELGPDASGWKKKMADENRCGLDRADDGSYRVLPGRANHPITYVSWYDAVGFLEWCGLRLPTEAEFEKALRGGLFLDGDAAKKAANPKPERRFPWGDEAPDAGGAQRCNLDGEADGFAHTSPVGRFAKFNSPYGLCDLSGNVAEWTSDWYATTYHVGLDGFRMVRGGSWKEVPDGVDAVSGATSLPLKESSLMGFRGVYPPN